MNHAEVQAAFCVFFLVQTAVMFWLSSTRQTSVFIPVFHTSFASGPPWSVNATGILPQNGGVFPMFAISTFLLITCIFHGLRAILFASNQLVTSEERWKPENIKTKKWNASTIRWIEYSITSTLMTLIIALMVGIVDVSALVCICVLNYGMIVLGFFGDVIRVEFLYDVSKNSMKLPFRRYARILFGFSSLLGITPWACFFMSYGFSANLLNGFPAVLALIITLFLLYLLFPLVYWYYLSQDKPLWHEEYVYDVLSAVAKTLLPWLTFGGIFASL